MRVLFCALLLLGSAAPAWATYTLTQEDALRIACGEAKRLDFEFRPEITCETDDRMYIEEGGTEWLFATANAAGNCNLEIYVNRFNGDVRSSTSCL